MPYTCHLCADAEPATVLITPLQGGDTMAIGADCMVVGLAGMLGVATQTDPEAIYDAIISLRAAAEAEAELAKPCEGCGHLMAAHGDRCLSDDCVCEIPGPPAGVRKLSRQRASRAKAKPVTQSEPAPA